VGRAFLAVLTFEKKGGNSSGGHHLPYDLAGMNLDDPQNRATDFWRDSALDDARPASLPLSCLARLLQVSEGISPTDCEPLCLDGLSDSEEVCLASPPIRIRVFPDPLP
jgi:hypothetical protein